MRNLLALLGAAVIILAVVGWFRNWYTVDSEAGPSGHHSVNIDIDKDRINKDIHKGGERLHDALERARKEVKKDAKPVEDSRK